MQIATFFLFIISIPFYLMFMLIFPEKHFALLALLYSPYTRIGAILTLLIAYIWYLQTKKHTKHNYDYFNDLQMMEAKTEGITYHYKIANKGEEDKQEYIEYIILYIDGNYGYDFSLKFETRFEKFLKFWKLTHECQSGDVQFDDMIYIVSDEQNICTHLTQNKQLREKLFNLFWEHKQNGYCIKSVQYFDGRIILTCKVENETKTVNTFLNKSTVQLTQIIPHLPPKREISEPLYREKTAYLSHFVYLVLGAFLLNGAIKFFLDSITTFYIPRLVDKYELIIPAIMLTAILLLLYLSLTLLVFRKSTRLARVLFLGATLGVVGFFLTSLTAIKEVNIYLDKSNPVSKTSQVISRYKRTGKSTSYYITFEGYNEMKVNGGFYSQFDDNTPVTILEKKGYLNMPWIIKITKNN